MKNFKPVSFLLALVFALGTALPTQAQSTAAEPAYFTAAELDQMLAPIALYPDTVLSHVLIASTYPLEVVQADRWVRTNQGMEAEAAVRAVEDQDWDPSVKALVAFPQILERMSDDLAWTQRLGDAFLDDEARVMDTIQNLRSKAYASGSLDRLEHVRVQRDKEVIIIEPAVERVVYVPVYDTRVVYGNWWWADYPPIYWHYPSHYTFVGGFYWGHRIHVGPSFYFSSFHWHRRHVVYVDHRRYHHRPHFHSGRSIVNYSGARHWRHNPTHRRGVAYHNDRARQHYGSNRDSYSTVHQQRGTQPQWRRDQQQANMNGARASRDVTGNLNRGNEGRPDARADGRVDGRPNLQRNSDRVREQLSNPQQGNTSRYTSGNANPRPGMGNNQAENRTRETGGESRAWSERGNSTLPSRNDPRPNLTRETIREVDRTQRAPQAGVPQRAQQPQQQEQPRAQRQVEGGRPNLGTNNTQVRPQANTQNTQSTQRIERSTSQQQIGQPAMPENARPMRTESQRPMRTESSNGRPMRTEDRSSR